MNLSRSDHLVEIFFYDHSVAPDTGKKNIHM